MVCPRSSPTHIGIGRLVPTHPVERGPHEKRRLGAERPQPCARPWRPTMQKKNITQQQLPQERGTARRACLPHKQFVEIHGSIDAKPAIAQLVEHLTVECCSNQMVPGSIPGGRTFCSGAQVAMVGIGYRLRWYAGGLSLFYRMLGGGRHTHEPTLHAGRGLVLSSISGLVVEYIVAIDVTRVRFPADALLLPIKLLRYRDRH